MYSQYTYQKLIDQELIDVTDLKAANISENTFEDFLPLDVVSGETLKIRVRMLELMEANQL